MSLASTDSDREQFLQTVNGFRTTAMLYVVAKLGVADHLTGGPKTAEELAEAVDAHPRSLFRVLRALAGLGFLTQDRSNRFGLTPKGRFLVTDAPDSLRAHVIATGDERYRSAGELLHTVLTGETAFNHLYGMGNWEYLSRHPEANAIFTAAMGQSFTQAENPLDRYDFTGHRLVVDVGGGRGDLISSILRRNPTMKGILYDLLRVAADVHDFLEKSGVSDRCEFVSGSAFESIPSGADVYVMSRVLHDWPDDKAAILLTNCRKAISKDGVLLIRETVLPEGDAPAMGKQLDVTMLFMTGGEERSEEEWRKLLRSSGFVPTNIWRTKGSFDLIEAKPI